MEMVGIHGMLRFCLGSGRLGQFLGETVRRLGCEVDEEIGDTCCVENFG